MLKKIAFASIVMTFFATGVAGAAKMGTYVTLHKTSLGNVLATVGGKTLYLYVPDGTTNTSTCVDACAQEFPPLKTATKPVAGMGVRQSLLHTTKRPGGRLQVTYNGHPLYTYSGDTAKGQTNGEGLDGNWYVVTAAGNQK
jgi:predicted lipoprotein with Yx(FWY)xxD motif